MEIRLQITAGPHAGKEFAFDRHDTFLVGRTKDAHLRLSYDDPYFSRRHFLIEVNPPRCRVIDLDSRNGIRVNGQRVEQAELKDQDEIQAGHTVFKVCIPPADPDAQLTFQMTEPYHPAAGGVPTVVHRPEPPPVPGYDLGEEIGRGGMGVVHRGTRAADGRAVAVKVISVAAGVQQRQVDRFLREARLLSQLRHPNVARFIDSGGQAPWIYLVMELVDGPNAGQVLQDKGPWKVSLGVRLVCQMLSALAHAHGRGIVHRDVKPTNVLLGGRKGKRVVKLADFGLARAYDDCKLSGLTFQGEVGGTPAYMAPEQVTHYRDVKPAADQYSAAATLYQLLTGHYPHDLPKNVSKQLAHIISTDPVPILTRGVPLPPAIAPVIHRAFAREPGDRFPDVTAFREALLPFAT
jgi:serine/threonine-protein kinase